MQKIKQFIESEGGKDLLTILIVILVGLGSFELGRLSKGDTSSGVKIEYPPQALNTTPDVSNTANITAAAGSVPSVSSNKAVAISSTPKPATKSFFASNRGNKYYSIGCSAGKTIKQENRIYFDTSTEAIAAGYELSSGCK